MFWQRNVHRARKMCYYAGPRAMAVAEGALRGNGITAYWYRDVLNFGDLITPLMLRHYGFTPVFDRPMRARFLAAGSILEHIQNEYAGIILGSGFIDEASRMSFASARVLAVRGKMTRERMGSGRESTALGDPGLLASKIMPRREQKEFLLGIIPHYADKESLSIAKLAERCGSEMTMIDVQQRPLKVFAAIDRCQHVLSSSLHGLIVADSLGIPNAWIAASNLIGGKFKFHDYFSSLDLPTASPVTLSGSESVDELVALTYAKPADKIGELQDILHRLWSDLSHTLNA